MMKKLNEYLEINNGLFSKFLAPVWCYAFPDATELDTYFITKYGTRIGFESMLDIYAGEDGKITGTNLALLADLIYHINARKWEHLFKVYNAEYSPIENTDFVEEVTEDNSNQRTIDSDKATSGTSSTTTSTTASGSDGGTTNRFGFNSSSAVGERSDSRTSSSTSGSTVGVTESGTATDDTTIHDNEDKNLIRRKHGNIGVTENVTMLQHEVDFWKWSFMDAICLDICDIIALSIY